MERYDGKIMRKGRSELGVPRGHSSVTALVAAENTITMKVMRICQPDLTLVGSKLVVTAKVEVELTVTTERLFV